MPRVPRQKGTTVVPSGELEYHSKVEEAIQHRLDEGYKLSDIRLEEHPGHTDVMIVDHGLMCRVEVPKFTMEKDKGES